MSYQDFLNSLISPITSFVSWLSLIANYLIHNYFFITFLGITLFISLVWFIFYLIFDFIDRVNNRYDDYSDKYYNYELLKEVQSDYLNNNYSDEFDYRYRNKVLNGQVLNSYLSNNRELDIDNKRLANFNKMESLKQIKNDILSDDDSSNDNDIDLIIPPKPQLSNKNELDNFERNELFNSSFNYANNNFLNKYGIFIDKKSNNYIDSSTGEVLSFDQVQYRIHNDNINDIILSDSEKNKILQKDFEDYNSLDIFENDFVRESKDTFYDEYYKGVYK